MMIRPSLGTRKVAILGLLGLLFGPSIEADTITVDSVLGSANEAGVCTLRDAITAANTDMAMN